MPYTVGYSHFFSDELDDRSFVSIDAAHGVRTFLLDDTSVWDSTWGGSGVAQLLAAVGHLTSRRGAS